MNDHSQRIIQIMQEKKMSATQFSEAIGIQRAAMSHITLGRNNPSADVITKIIERFEDINPGWLLTGKGTMKNVQKQPEDGQADLFESKRFSAQPSNKGINRADFRPQDDHYPTETVSQVEKSSNIIEKEVVIYKERPVKTIEKLVIFFSDKTFETFLPEVAL